MTPKQCARNPSLVGSDEKIGGGADRDVWSMVTAERDGRRRRRSRHYRGVDGDGVDGDGVTGPSGPLELMQFAVGQMNEHVEWVNELEENAASASPATAINDGVRARRHLVMDSLVTIAHVAHRFLRHNDPRVREAAELLTTGTACLIGRMYSSFGTVTGLMR